MSDAVAKPERRRETILLIGASSDIGLEIIRQESVRPEGDDAPLFLAHYHRSLAKLERLRESMPGVNIVPLEADLSRLDDVESLAKRIQTEHPIVNKIVHLAAPKFEYRRFKDIRWDDFQRELDVQLRSLVCILQGLLPGMAQRKQGRVVVVLSSVTLNVPPAALAHYVTAKFALLGLVRALAAEYASRHVNINAVSPSMVETAFLEKLPERMVEIAASQHPRQRNATPRDVAATVRFLLSDDAEFITGANLPISGGMSF